MRSARQNGVNDPARELAAEYSAMACAYAAHWAPVIGPMALPLLSRLPLAGAARVLDVGTGTGELVPALRAATAGALIVGVDRAEGMLRLARQRAGLDCAVMDAQRLALRGRSFDIALLAFVLFHFPQPHAALREVHRVLRPGGMVGVVTWGDDPGVPGQHVWAEALDAFGAAPDPRDASVMQHDRTDTPDKLAVVLEQAGFECETLWTERFIHRWTTQALLALQIGCGTPGRRLASLAPRARSECLRRVRSQLARLSAEERVYRPEVVFAVASRRTGRLVETTTALR